MLKFGRNSICGFFGEYRYLSNFYGAPLVVDGILYPTSEHAFQAAKTLDMRDRLIISNISSPAIAKKMGKAVQLREDWEYVKVTLMKDIVRLKFLSNPQLAIKLLGTDELYLEETNTWNDTFWGVCDGKGKNMLGHILMDTRDEIIGIYSERKTYSYHK